MQRDSMVFYRSFMEATDNLEPIQYKNVFQMLFHYAMDGEQPKAEGIEYTLFSLMKPQIDANNRKYENGKKGAEFGKLGGRPKKETPKKPHNNPTQTGNANEECINDNENVSDNVKCNKYFDDPALNKAFLDYMDMRRRMKKPMTERAVNLAIKKLHELADIPFSDEINCELAIKILNQSIFNSWKGLFPIETDKKTGNASKSISESWENA